MNPRALSLGQPDFESGALRPASLPLRIEFIYLVYFKTPFKQNNFHGLKQADINGFSSNTEKNFTFRHYAVVVIVDKYSNSFCQQGRLGKYLTGRKK